MALREEKALVRLNEKEKLILSHMAEKESIALATLCRHLLVKEASKRTAGKI